MGQFFVDVGDFLLRVINWLVFVPFTILMLIFFWSLAVVVLGPLLGTIVFVVLWYKYWSGS